MRAALKTKLPDEFEGQYVLGMSGVPLAKSESKSAIARLRQVTTLQTKNRQPLEAGVAQHLHCQLAAFVHFPVLGGDGGLANPGLQTLHRFIMALFDLGPDGGEFGPFGLQEMRKSECGSGGSGSHNEVSTIHGRKSNADVQGCLREEFRYFPAT